MKNFIFFIAIVFVAVLYHNLEIERAVAAEREAGKIREIEARNKVELVVEAREREACIKKVEMAATENYDLGCRICTDSIVSLYTEKMDSQSRAHEAEKDSMIRAHHANIQKVIQERDIYWVDRLKFELEQRAQEAGTKAPGFSRTENKGNPSWMLLLRNLFFTLAIAILVNVLRAFFHRHGRLNRNWRI